MKKTKGVLTVEATLVYPFFVVLMVTIINFLNIFYIQLSIQQAINNTANKVSECSYVLEKLEIKEKQQAMEKVGKNIDEIASSVDNLVNKSKEVANLLLNGINLNHLDILISKATEFSEAVGKVGKSLEAVSSNDLIGYMIYMVVEDLVVKGEQYIAQALTEQYLKDMKVNTSCIEGGLDFSKTHFFKDGSDDITIVVTYRYKNPFGIKFFDTIDMAQIASIRAWVGAS